MEYIKTYNKEEKEIYDICCSDKVDYDRIDYLLKNGASANAVEITKYDNQEENKEDLLLVQCWLDGQFNRRFYKEEKQIETDSDFCIKLLKLFIDNGLDVDKYVNHIFTNIQFTYDNKNYIEMTKLILNNLKNRQSINQEEALTGIGWEESYNNCCEADHRYANVLSTIYEMIEKYSEGGDPNKYYTCNQIIGQKIEYVQIYCKDLKIDMPNKIIASECDVFIQCEKDRLNILNKMIFVNNNEIKSKFERINSENYFENELNNYLKNEIIEDIQFYNEQIVSKPKTECNVARIEIVISNNKKIIFNTDESLSFIKITKK